MHKFEREQDKGVRKNPGRNKLLIKEKTLTNVGVFFHMPGLPIRTGYRDRRRTSFEGAKGRANKN